MPAFDPANSAAPQTDGPLKSTLSDDPDMVELVEFFVEQMSNRVDVIRTATDEQNIEELRTIAHQLKGAGLGYGFEPISNCAGALEKLIDGAGPDAQVDSFRQQIDDLINLCSRVKV